MDLDRGLPGDKEEMTAGIRHLFDNRALAEAMLSHWRADSDSRNLGWHRTANNAVYRFWRDGRPCYLRFTSTAMRAPENVAAELAFITYLRAAGYPAAEPLTTRTGELVAAAATVWGEYCAVAFAGVSGQVVKHSDFTDDAVFAWGRALGHLHLLSERYVPTGTPRWSDRDILGWVAGIAERLEPDPRVVLGEIARVEDALDRLPADGQSYGLIHTDLECDNVFFDAATGVLSVIDFDSAMYHWYDVDLRNAVENLVDHVELADGAAKRKTFLSGYASMRSLPSPVDGLTESADRFLRLFWYGRARLMTAEVSPDDPEWFQDYRDRVAARLKTLVAGWGNPP